MKCHFCDQPAVGVTKPLLCEKHFDIAVLSEYLVKHDEPVSVEAVQALRKRCLDNGGVLSVSDDDITSLMSGEFAQGYEMRKASDDA